MITIKRESSLDEFQVHKFLENLNFKLPNGFIDFFQKSNGGLISGDDVYVVLWPLSDMIKLNQDYNVDTYAPEFFIFGSDGGDTAYCIKKQTSQIFQMPFIGMADEANFICENFYEFLEGNF